MKKVYKLNIQVQKLDIIFLTDIHNHRDNLQMLAEHVRSNSLHFDYCFVGGDIVNCEHSKKEHNQEKEHQAVKDILLFLHDLFQCKVLFIPGNHDPLVYFKGENHVSPDILNIHQKEFVLEVGLKVVGLGGSTPGYTDVEYKNKVWEGFPYQSDKDYEKDIDAVFKKDQLKTSSIFLTHVGPALSSTTLHRRGKEPPIFGGSKVLDKVEDDQNLIIHLHGHIHEGAKYDKFNEKPIVNPGALSNGEYGIIKLKRYEKDWKLEKVSFLKLH